MRTTIEIPDHLLRLAKRQALEDGTTLREVVAGALEKALVSSESPVRRTTFPIIASQRTDKLSLTNAEIDSIVYDDDALPV